MSRNVSLWQAGRVDSVVVEYLGDVISAHECTTAWAACLQAAVAADAEAGISALAAAQMEVDRRLPLPLPLQQGQQMRMAPPAQRPLPRAEG